MTRILHVLEALEGGTARHLVDVVAHTPEFEHEVVIPPRRVGGVTDTAAADRLVGAGAVVHVRDLRRLPAHPANASGLAAILRLVHTRGPDIVHGHSSIGGALARMAAATARLPSVYTPNGIAENRVAVRLERALGRLTTRFVAVSESEAALARRLGLVLPDRIAVVPNGIEVEFQPSASGRPTGALRKLLGLAPRTPLVGTVARLVAQKAPEVFVRACAVARKHAPDAHFVLIGDGPLARRVAAERQLAGLDGCFHVVPVLPGAAALLDQLDVFAMSSRFEGAPYAPLEAMRARVPVVLTDVVGNRDVVEPGRSGLLVPPDDPESLGRAIAGLLADGALRTSLGAAGAARVRASYDVRVMGERLAEVYRSTQSLTMRQKDRRKPPDSAFRERIEGSRKETAPLVAN